VSILTALAEKGAISPPSPARLTSLDCGCQPPRHSNRRLPLRFERTLFLFLDGGPFSLLKPSLSRIRGTWTSDGCSSLAIIPRPDLVASVRFVAMWSGEHFVFFFCLPQEHLPRRHLVFLIVSSFSPRPMTDETFFFFPCFPHPRIE